MTIDEMRKRAASLRKAPQASESAMDVRRQRMKAAEAKPVPSAVVNLSEPCRDCGNRVICTGTLNYKYLAESFKAKCPWRYVKNG